MYASCLRDAPSVQVALRRAELWLRETVQRRDRMKFIALYSLKEGVDETKLAQAVQKRAECTSSLKA
jgi:hypothetical protein